MFSALVEVTFIYPLIYIYRSGGSQPVGITNQYGNWTSTKAEVPAIKRLNGFK